MKIKKLIVAVLAIALIATGVLSNGIIVKAGTGPAIVFSQNNFNLVVTPGETSRIRLPINAVDDVVIDAKASVIDQNPESPFTFSDPVLMTDYDAKTTTIPIVRTTYVEFDVEVNETAGIKSYPITLKINGRLTSSFDNLTPAELTLDFKLKILEEKSPAQLSITDVVYYNAEAGSEMDLTFRVRNDGEIAARNTYINVNYGDTGIVKGYTADNIKIGDIEPGKDQYVTLHLKVQSTATSGKKTLTANFKYKDITGKESTSSTTFDVKIEENKDAPNLEIRNTEYNNNIKPGDEFVLKATLQNYGTTSAMDIKVAVVSENPDTDSFIRNYYSDNIEVENIKAYTKKQVEIPLIVSHGVTGSLNKLKLNITYTDHLGITYTETKTIYLNVAVEGPEKASIVIGNVKQYPAQPSAGENLEISFDFENKGTADITELKVAPVLSADTFIPQASEPYQYIDRVKSGETIRITLPLIVSDNIAEGLNNLTVNFTYAGGGTDSAIIPVRDVQNAMGSSSIPKLIISKYTTDVEEIRAGGTFNFTFDIYNSHSSVNAKNITVTVTQAENIFTVTQGSNSFFIQSIKPGEAAQQTLEMKVKSDTKTNAYKLNIKVEYEYDGIKPNIETGKIGETKEYELNLQAIENARPVVDYVNVYSFDGNVMMGNPAMLSFEFYNMGKSSLNNVIATVEGDFTKSDGNMYFVGNVMEGSSSYVEFEVMPNLEGLAKGVVKITYEDSNGDEVEFLKEFETTVMGAQVFDPGMMDGGMDVFNPTVPEPKKPILPTWLFILIEIVVFVAFIPITRKIIISIYKKKLLKKEEANY